MERTVVRCAEGHLFSTSAFPMQNLGPDRLGPGRLLRCPRCARLRSAVRADLAGLTGEQIERARRLDADAIV
ncbi:hypothetical protein [Wenjunlia tyrosinilytica]|jgi:hypothetical protein|uniref:Formate-dependent nitrite reductase complex subunit NrfF n=1 Tax=Wenjunlia tyrosinilytica TaxID=1544741 RepID=A0A917ZMF5_9ACTN|nr:hypothetical protein [Wenjunlia tyrosinilytica]GGO84898.1 hypothetical protein GCM10012280_17430 [Wenjunlia tyrosinilytica]